MALFCKLHTLQLWAAPSPQVRQLRGLVDRLQVLKDISLAEGNRLQINAHNAVLKPSIEAHLDWLAGCMKALQSRQLKRRAIHMRFTVWCRPAVHHSPCCGASTQLPRCCICLPRRGGFRVF